MGEAAVVTEAVVNTAKNADISTWFVVVLGMGIVFIGLVVLILLIQLMGSVMKKIAPAKESAPVAAPAADVIPNRGELVAAVSAALAEELGTDIKAIRIHSIKRV